MKKSIIVSILSLTLLGVFVFTEARAERSLFFFDFTKNPDACDEIVLEVIDELASYNDYRDGWMGSTSSEQQKVFDKGMDRHSARAANFATVYNTFCKD